MPTASRNLKPLIQPEVFWRKRPLLQYFGEIYVLCLPEHGIAKLMVDPLFFSFSDTEKALVRVWKIFWFCFCFVKHSLPQACVSGWKMFNESDCRMMVGDY